MWQDRRNGSWDIYGAIVNQSGVVTHGDIVICNAAGDQVRPRVAYDAGSNQYVVVWSDPRSGTADIYGARVSPAGTVLDANGVLVSGAAGAQFSPASSSAAASTSWSGRIVAATRATSTAPGSPAARRSPSSIRAGSACIRARATSTSRR